MNKADLQNPEDPVLASKNRNDAAQALSWQTHDVIDFVPGKVVILVLAVAVMVIDITCTDE